MMKKWILIFAAVCGGLGLQTASAQLHVNVNLNLGSQPDWGPAGYNYAHYYYMPDINAYYDVPRHEYIYPQGNRWVFAASLPPRYHGYDIYRGYKVVINGDRPYLRNNYYRKTYARYRGDYGRQPLLRDHRGNNGRGHAYGHEKDHGNPGRGHGRGNGNQGHGNDHGNGHDHGHGN